jgi:SulP family sulfate permease
VDVSILEVVERDDGRLEEREPARRLRGDAVTVLDVYGHLFYAGARTLEQRLPRPAGDGRPVVILRLRGRTNLGATLVEVLANYADALHAAGGRLYISGLNPSARAQVARTGKLQLDGPVRLYEATPVIGESTRAALGDAEGWLADRRTEG